jgi:hypothetical protein
MRDLTCLILWFVPQLHPALHGIYFHRNVVRRYSRLALLDSKVEDCILDNGLGARIHRLQFRQNGLRIAFNVGAYSLVCRQPEHVALGQLLQRSGSHR